MITKLLEANAKNAELAADPASTVIAPWWKQFEQWAGAAVAMLGTLMEFGVIGENTKAGRAIGLVLMVAGYLGVGVSRTLQRMNANKVAGALEAAKVGITAADIQARAVDAALKANIPLPKP
jgi:hypothetical protein